MNPYDIIKTVKLTEKGTVLTEQNNQYLVVADIHASKPAIKKAVEEIFKVKVIAVNTMHVLGKPRRRFSKTPGSTPAWKKAIVTLKEGDKIVLT
jgi:large subunit ribosomal protein L23